MKSAPVQRADTLARALDRALMPAAGLAASLPILVAATRAVLDGWAPLGDDALIAVRSFDVLSSHPPLVGMPSTGPTGVLDEPTFHLGPLLFWLLALPAHFLGPSSLAVTAGLVNIASCLGTVALAERRGGRPLMVATAIAVPVMLLSLPPESYSDIWNPALAVMPFMLLVALAWSLACGEHRLLPLTVVVASFVAQCHLIFLLPALACLGVGLGGLAMLHLRGAAAATAAENPGRVRPWLLAALVLTLICWSGPLIDQAFEEPGNLEQLARAARADTASLGATIGARAVVRAIGLPPWWLRDSRGALERIGDLDNAPDALATGTALLVLAALVGALAGGWRRRLPDVIAAATLALALCAAISLATASVPRGSFVSTGYALWWASPAGMWVWLLLTWSVVRLLRHVAWTIRSRPVITTAGVLAAAVAGLIVAARAEPPAEPFAELRTVTSRLARVLPEGRSVRVEGTWEPDEVFLAGGFQLGLVYWLLTDGRAVTAPSLPDLGTPYGRSDGDAARVRVDVDEAPPEAGRPIARISVPTGDSDNPFSRAPSARTVGVTLLPPAKDR